ncbi:MAG: sensor domain-containing diguanylate cyclase [Deltaproteobacteria bacterium]|nr:sensor domain-containing diguanylate cyclase [Candidatus Anaeroferrophillus wilburensis]MBN2889493.1 sensor domain-containing diguanylate cyclase [Deltaproteobacteria bacterium]
MTTKPVDTDLNNTVIDAKGAIFEKIFAENRELREKLARIMAISRENQDRQHHYNQVEDRIFAAENLPQLLLSLQQEVGERFTIPMVSVALLNSVMEGIENTRLATDQIAINMTPTTTMPKEIYLSLFPNHKPLIFAGIPLELAAFFPAAKNTTVGSSAAIPLAAGNRCMGILMLISDDPEKFQPTMATDFIERLGSRLAIAIENLAIRGQLEKASRTDQLTGVFNRHSLKEILRLEFERAKRYQHPLSLMMIDLDDFKQINDHHGHGVGDLVLTQLGVVLMENTRSNDAVFRYGGDEFLIIMPHTNQLQAQRVAEKILAKTRDGEIFLEGSLGLSCSLSIGQATFPTSGIDSPETLLEVADEHLYAAKKAGKGRVKSG